MDLSEISSSDLIDELASRCNDDLVLAYQFTDDGGNTATRFYTGSKWMVTIGLARALSLDIENRYLHATTEDPED